MILSYWKYSLNSLRSKFGDRVEIKSRSRMVLSEYYYMLIENLFDYHQCTITNSYINMCSWIVVHLWKPYSYIEEASHQSSSTNYITFSLREKLEHSHSNPHKTIKSSYLSQAPIITFLLLQYETKVKIYKGKEMINL